VRQSGSRRHVTSAGCEARAPVNGVRPRRSLRAALTAVAAATPLTLWGLALAYAQAQAPFPQRNVQIVVPYTRGTTGSESEISSTPLLRFASGALRDERAFGLIQEGVRS
jgi:hypothetical protein